MNAICKHCRQRIMSTGPLSGRFWVHVTTDGFPGLSRCNPKTSGLSYGYNADPEGEPCQPPCLGAPVEVRG